jgi:Glycosyl-4,4'-diaponeurosporenoate acyltransferase
MSAIVRMNVNYNIIPMALMCAGWIVPMLRFWLQTYLRGVAPSLPWFLAACAACVAVWWLPAAYYRVHGFERSGRVYELLGVRWFRHIVPDGDFANRWRRRREPGHRVISNRAGAQAFLIRYLASERSHLVLLLAGFATSAYAWRIGWNGWAWYLFAANVAANVYPILLQRYTRARITRLTDGRKSAKAAPRWAPGS